MKNTTLRNWLRDNSSLVAKIDPPKKPIFTAVPVPTYPCACGNRMPRPMETHQIGWVHYPKGPKKLYCDGSEV